MSTVQSIPAPQVLHEAGRRRTFAVISHPDAGKSTLTEALALHARAITSAGAVHAKGDRRGVTSDWMELERERGISVTSAALQFDYRGHVMNLVDTPGHADFSEDTYRVLAARGSAQILGGAAKWLEGQTPHRFAVWRPRGPVFSRGPPPRPPHIPRGPPRGGGPPARGLPGWPRRQRAWRSRPASFSRSAAIAASP
ncbi:GTP-binding protein [Kitasatospora purpeofusca]|uniref:GTP-binding protein n=1 Tax=Kitasatospora purpeofusca TaxID=67352 RepID=UPI0036889E6D